MKKILKGVLAVFVAAALFSCSDGGSGSKSDPAPTPPPAPEPHVADIDDNGSYVSLAEYPPANEKIPEDSIRKYVKDARNEWSIYNVFDLAKLAEIVNGGDSLKDVTVTVQNDITVNKNLLSEDFKEPEELDFGSANPKFNILDSIGRFWGNNSKDTSEGGLGEEKIEAPFEGIFDGNGKVISGFYAYQGHQGLGLIGYAKNAVIKNVILKDACIVNYNIWSGTKSDGTDTHDGYDDDRFGGIIGLVGEGTTTVENCFFSGVIGSKDALDRCFYSSSYSYIGGLAGLVDTGTLSASNTIVWSRIYSNKTLYPLTGSTKHNGIFNKDESVKGSLIDAYDDAVEAEIEADLETVKGWISNPFDGE